MPALLALLESPNHNLRNTATFSLGELRVEAAAEPLLALTASSQSLILLKK